MQTRSFRSSSHTGHLQRYVAQETVFEKNVESKYDVSEEMMGLEWLLAFQAIIENNETFCRQHAAKLVLGDCVNYFFLDDLRLRVVLPKMTRLQKLAKTLNVPSKSIVWGRPHREDRLTLTQVLKLCSAHADVIKLV